MNFLLRTNKSKNLAKNIVNIDNEQRKVVNRVMIFTNARDEKNIKEWAAHHLLLGFDFVYIFDHKSVVPLTSEFANFDSRVYVERCEIPSKVKIPLMNRAKTIANKFGADWMIYLDADEFVILNYFKNVKEMLYAFRFADQLAINWVPFGSNNHTIDPEGLMLDNYTRSDAKLDHHVKSFVRPSQIINATSPHFYNIVNSLRNITINNKILSPPNAFNECDIKFDEAHAFIAHYAIQSEETHTRRKVNLPTDNTGTFRGNPNSSDLHKAHNSTENCIPKIKYAERVKKFLSNFDGTFVSQEENPYLQPEPEPEPEVEE
uniref:Glycosyltransferase family 92 protein n=1 Tax=viral metagenome TaxID=1070528 RepID=A0A6C0KXQ0_9ZZZZ